MLGLRLGCRLVTLPRCSPEWYLRSLALYRPSVLTVDLALSRFLATSPAVTPDLLDSVRLVNAGADHLDGSSVERLRQKLPADVRLKKGFGATECLVALTESLEEGVSSDAGESEIRKTVLK